jgi:hypothetical protein
LREPEELGIRFCGRKVNMEIPIELCKSAK